MERIEKLQAMMRDQGLDAIVVTNKITKQYLGLVTGSGCVPVVLVDRVVQFMDGRYQNESYRLRSAEKKVLDNRDYYGAIIPFLKEMGSKVVGLEDEGISVAKYLEMREFFEIRSVGELIVTMRSIKDQDEIARFAQLVR